MTNNEYILICFIYFPTPPISNMMEMKIGSLCQCIFTYRSGANMLKIDLLICRCYFRYFVLYISNTPTLPTK